LIFTNVFSPRIQGYSRIYDRYAYDYAEIRRVFAEIPPDSVVAASAFFTPQLLHVEKLYHVGNEYRELFDIGADYIVFDLRSADLERYARVVRIIMEDGYVLAESANFFEIYMKRD